MAAPTSRLAALAYDVVVFGAGPAGAASAIALRQRGFSVALLERAPCSSDGATPFPSNETPSRAVWSAGESISALAQYPLRELGLWEGFVAEGHRPSYLTQSAWGSDELREKHAISQQAGPDFHVDRLLFDAWLRTRALAAGAELFDATTAASADWDPETRRFTVSCSSERFVATSAPSPGATKASVFEASYLIDATGRPAWLLRKLGGTRARIDDLIGVGRHYAQAHFEPSILVEAVPDGWWYSGPLPGHQALALHLTWADRAKAARSEDGFLRLVAQAPHTRARLASAVPSGPIRVCSAAPMRSVWDTALPFLPVGDAAASFDPISGSGLCFAFRSALEAAMVLGEARARGERLFVAYQDGVQSVFDDHLQRRRELYAHERRWPDSGFWSRFRD